MHRSGLVNTSNPLKYVKTFSCIKKTLKLQWKNREKEYQFLKLFNELDTPSVMEMINELNKKVEDTEIKLKEFVNEKDNII